MLNILKKLRKSSDTFGLDIGTSAVKAVQIKSGSVTGMASVGLPADTIADGSIRDTQAVADAIKEAVVKAGIGGLEAEHHIPFAIDEVFIDHHTLGRSSGQMDVILVAVKKSKVNEYMAVVDQAGFNPLIVDVDGFALGNQWELNFPCEAREAVALIDIGAAIMKTNVVRGGATIFARDIPFGGNNYTQAIAQRLNISFQQAEDAKLGKDVGVKWETLVPPLEAISRELSLEVQRTFDYFASTAESERIGKIVLAGGCAQLPGLNEYLASNWGIPVELARPFERIDVAPAYAEEAAAMAPALAVAVGLGLRRSGDKEQSK